MHYGDIEAVGGIDLQIERGEIFAFLGPNGAGKTTTAEILEGIRSRSAGAVTVLGDDPETAGAQWRARIGVVFQECEPERGLTVLECLRLYAGYYPHARAPEEVLEMVGLSDKAGSMAGKLSGGQRRRLDVGLALVGNPELLFLDEPTTGFDPSARREAWQMIRGLRSLGVTVFLTTHFMDEAEHLADRIAVIVAGKIVAEGTPESIGGRERAQASITFEISDRFGPDGLLDELGIGASRDDLGRVVLKTSSPAEVLAPLLAWAKRHGIELHDLEVRRPTLEDTYLALTARDPRSES